MSYENDLFECPSWRRQSGSLVSNTICDKLRN